MASTTNYSWTTPDDTALVKDGAAAIRSLGSAIDTTTKALNPSTTLGDIEYRSATANTNTRLAIGTSGQVLTVNGSGVPAWATAASGSMTLLSTTSISGASVTVSSISQSYKNLYIEWQNVTQSANGTFDIQLNSTNGAHYSAVASTTATSVGGFNDNVLILLRGDDALATGGNNFGSVFIYNYASTNSIKTFQAQSIWTNASSVVRSLSNGGGFNSNSAVSSLKFNSTTGNTFNAGTLRIYGVN